MRNFLLAVFVCLLGFTRVSGGEELWKQYARLNHRIGQSADRYYREACGRVDIAIEDLKELKRQGKDYPADLLVEAEKASKEIFRRWLEIERERVRFERELANILKTTNSSGGNEELKQRGEELIKEVEAFGRWAMKLADEIDAKTLPFRKGLKYAPIADPEKSRFLRGICFHGKNGMVKDRSDKNRLAYKMMDFEYQAKAIRGIGVNLVYSDIYSYVARQAALRTFCEVGLPFVQVGRRNFGHERDIRFNYYYTHHQQWVNDLKKWLERWRKPYPMFWAVGVDEPVIRDKPEILDSPIVKDAFVKYLQARKEILNKARVRVPDRLDLRSVQAGKFGKAIWVEYQMFKREFMAEQYKWLNEKCEELGTRLVAIIMTHNHYFAQDCSWVALGKVLPRMSTDLYRDGRLFEGFNFQLFRNAVEKKAWMTPGAGYSCRTADHFRRSLAISMVYGDGVLQWTNLYCSKYRGPLFFWRGDGTQPVNDDRGRPLRDCWSWQYWPIMETMYRQMEQADKYLSVRDSTNDVVILFSERESILGTYKRPKKYFVHPYFYENLYIYSDLIRHHISADVGFLEVAERKGLGRYRVAVLSSAKSITPRQQQLLSEWVNRGGTLIVSADTASYDMWGRKAKRYLLADVFGIEKEIGNGKGSYFNAMGRKVSFDKPEPFVKVELPKRGGASVIGRWNNGQPALLKHRFGKGCVFFFTSQSIARRLSGSPGIGGLAGESVKGLADVVCEIVRRYQKKPVIRVVGLPEGLEVQVRKQDDMYVVHLLDWYDGRDVKGELEVHLPGVWKVFYPYPLGERKEKVVRANERYELRSFRIHDMIVVEPADIGQSVRTAN